jgi:hypothetical protein
MRALSLVRNTIALSALALGGSLTAASAQDVHYTAGTSTIDVAHSVLGDAIVGADALFNTSNPITGNPYNATVNVVTGGSVGGGLSAFNSSQVNVSGGSIANGMSALDSSQVNISGGAFGNAIFAFGNSQSQVNISGGTFGQASFGGPGVNFFDLSTGGFTLIGHKLAATNVGADLFNGGTDFALTGTLLDGTDLSGYVLNLGDSSAFNLSNVTPAAVPELSSLLGFGSFLALGGLAAFRQRKTGRKAV